MCDVGKRVQTCRSWRGNKSVAVVLNIANQTGNSLTTGKAERQKQTEKDRQKEAECKRTASGGQLDIYNYIR